MAARTGYYIVVSRTDPDYATIITDCTTKHQTEAPGTNLSVVEWANGQDLIKIKNGDYNWRSGQSWFGSIIQAFENTTLSDAVRVAYDSIYSTVPTDTANCELWLDCSMAQWVTATDNLVSELIDKSGNGRDAIQVTGSLQPTYDEGNAEVIFDGVDNVMTVSTAATFKFLHETDHTVFLVFTITDADPGTAMNLISTYTGTGTGYRLEWYDVTAANNAAFCRIGNGSGNIISDYAPNDTFPTQQKNLIVTTWENGVTGNDFSYWVRATQSDTSETSGTPSVSNPDTVLTLGGASFKGSFHELIIYSRKLTTEEILNVVGYLSQKWSLS